MFTKKLIRRHFPLVGAAILAASAGSVMGQIVVNFGENGKGTIQTPNGTIPLTSLGNITDPFDPGNGLMPLAYNLVGTLGAAPIDGDINLIEPTGGPSDLIRFEHGLLIVYSDLEAGVPNQGPADVGIPTLNQQNLFITKETGPEPGPNGLFGYTPGAGQPGAFSAPVTYNFLSDPAVPEPASVTLLAVGSSALLVRRRRRR